MLNRLQRYNKNFEHTNNIQHNKNVYIKKTFALIGSTTLYRKRTVVLRMTIVLSITISGLKRIAEVMKHTLSGKINVSPTMSLNMTKRGSSNTKGKTTIVMKYSSFGGYSRCLTMDGLSHRLS